MRSTGYALLAALVALCGASEALAADEAAVLRLQAAHLGSEGQCARALPLVRRSRAMAPDDAGAALLEGECALNEQHYAEALEPLEDARRLDPEQARRLSLCPECARLEVQARSGLLSGSGVGLADLSVAATWVEEGSLGGGGASAPLPTEGS